MCTSSRLSQTSQSGAKASTRLTLDGIIPREEKFLLRRFAEYKTPVEAGMLFRAKFGRLPTETELLRCNIGGLIKAQSASVKYTPRMRFFSKRRELWRRNVRNNTLIATPEGRLAKFAELFDIGLEKARQTGNVGPCADILEKAAKEVAKYWEKTPTVNVDARQVNVGISALPDSELNRRINELMATLVPPKNGNGQMIEHVAAPDIMPAPESDTHMSESGDGGDL